MLELYNDFAYDIEDIEDNLSDNEKQNIIYEWLRWDMDNLQNVLDLVDTYDGYIISGSIQRWDGTYNGYKTAEKLTDVIYKAIDGFGMVYLNIYIDQHNNLIIEVSHHDGHNKFTVKGVKSPSKYTRIEWRLWDCIKGNYPFNKSDTKYFRSLGKAIKVYF